MKKKIDEKVVHKHYQMRIVFQTIIKNLFYKDSHSPLPLGRWLSVTKNHDILEVKYKSKIKRHMLLEQNIDPYQKFKDIKDIKDSGGEEIKLKRDRSS